MQRIKVGAPLAANDRVDPFPPRVDEGIGPVAAVDEVITRATIKRVIAGMAVYGIVARISVKDIIAFFATEEVIARAAKGQIIINPHPQHIIAAATVKGVVALTIRGKHFIIKDVAARAARNLVIAAERLNVGVAIVQAGIDHIRLLGQDQLLNLREGHRMAGDSISHQACAGGGEDHCHRVGQPRQIQRVIVGAALATDDSILAKSCGDEEHVIVAAAIKRIIARTAVQRFVAIPTIDGVIARPADNRVVSGTSFHNQPRRI